MRHKIKSINDVQLCDIYVIKKHYISLDYERRVNYCPHGIEPSPVNLEFTILLFTILLSETKEINKYSEF